MRLNEIGLKTYNQLPRPPFKEWKERAKLINQTHLHSLFNKTKVKLFFY